MNERPRVVKRSNDATNHRQTAPPIEMNQHARMLRTLACLALAMTGTAFALHWLDPTRSIRGQSISAEEIRSLARSLVSDSVEINPRQWKSVEVLGDPVDSMGGTPLTAVAHPGEFHFHVNAAGLPSRARGWSLQNPSLDAPHAVRIRVARSDDNDFPTPSQWFTIRSLVEALDAALLLDGAMPVHVRRTAGDVAVATYRSADLRPTP